MLRRLGLGILVLFSLATGSARALQNPQEISYWGKVKIPHDLRVRFISDQKCYSDLTYLRSCVRALQAAANLLPTPVSYSFSDSTLAEMLTEPKQRISFETLIEQISQVSLAPAQMVWGHAISAHLQEYDSEAELTPLLSDEGGAKKGPAVRSYVGDVDARIGVVEVSSFESEQTCAQTQFEIQKLQKAGIENLVLDLRENTGGRRLEALCVAGLFLGLQKVIGIRDATAPIPEVDQVVSRVRFSKNILWLGGSMVQITKAPLAVWISKKTESATEMVAGALQEHHRAIVVGEKTRGQAKSRVTKSIPGTTLGLRFTSEELVLPSGRSYANEGIKPDFEADWQNSEAESKAIGFLKSSAKSLP